MEENFGWYLGYGITIAVVLVVVANAGGPGQPD